MRVCLICVNCKLHLSAYSIQTHCLRVECSIWKVYRLLKAFLNLWRFRKIPILLFHLCSFSLSIGHHQEYSVKNTPLKTFPIFQIKVRQQLIFSLLYLQLSICLHQYHKVLPSWLQQLFPLLLFLWSSLVYFWRRFLFIRQFRFHLVGVFCCLLVYLYAAFFLGSQKTCLYWWYFL